MIRIRKAKANVFECFNFFVSKLGVVDFSSTTFSKVLYLSSFFFLVYSLEFVLMCLSMDVNKNNVLYLYSNFKATIVCSFS